MRVTRVFAVAVLAASAAVGVSHAQSLSRGDVSPAEFPPSSFKGKQYVDSRGCVFIRAGIDGTITWVPRVNRSRSLICGQKPTLGARVAAAPVAAPKKAPVKIEMAPAPKVAAAPKPKRVKRVAKPIVRAAAPKVTAKPKRIKRVAAPKVVAKPVIIAAPKPVAAPKAAPVKVRRAAVVAQPAPRQPACEGASALSRKYINSGARSAVRCGSQTSLYGAGGARRVAAAPVAPAPVVRAAPVAAYKPRVVRRVAAAPAAGSRRVTAQTRVVPRHVFTDRLNTQSPVVPKGYRLAWDDDRLNPKRAEQTLGGHASMNLIWTSTVPRRLINQVNGADVTAGVPLVYPYTDIATQQRELGQVTLERREGVLVKRIKRNTATATYRKPAYRAPTLSSRSAPVPAAAAPVTRRAPKAAPVRGERITGKGYVSLGTYGDAASAQSAAKRAMRMGMSARVGKFMRSGREMRMVLVGPFESAASQSKALSKMRSAGFRSAQLR